MGPLALAAALVLSVVVDWPHGAPPHPGGGLSILDFRQDQQTFTVPCVQAVSLGFFPFSLGCR